VNVVPFCVCPMRARLIGTLVLLVLGGLSLLPLFSGPQAEASSSTLTGVQIWPAAFVADTRTEVHVSGVDLSTTRLALRPLHPSRHEGTEIALDLSLRDDNVIVTTIALAAGRYEVRDLSSSTATGQIVTAAEPFPPRPVDFDHGGAISLQSFNFPTSFLQAGSARVTIAKLPKGNMDALRLHDHSLREATFLAKPAAGHCTDEAPSSSPSRRFVLESCAHPGLLLAHGRLQADSVLRLALPIDGRCSDTGAVFTHRTPGLEGDGTTTLVAVDGVGGTGAPAAARFVARHANSRLKLSRAELDSPTPLDALLRADSSWRLVPPADTTCASRAIGRASTRSGGDHGGDSATTASSTLAISAAALAKPTHVATLHVSIDGEPLQGGPLAFELYGNVVPKTVENFVALCNGEHPTRKYAGTTFQRVIPGFMAQGGSTDGGYGESARGGKFADESFALGHDAVGVLSMANAGEDTNGSQFFVLFRPQPHLDGKHVVLGRLVRTSSSSDPDGIASLREIEAAGSNSGKTRAPVRIDSCSAIRLGEP
jgi:cyclophilin family peptidyl-prolyl cis-trans isomerase